MIRSVAAELLVLRKRASTWILLAVWVLLGLLFAYLLPYVTYTSNPRPGGLGPLLPDHLIETLLGGFPFFGGVFALILGVLAVGGDYGWDTLKTLLTQRHHRLTVFCAKLIALAVVVVAFVLAMFLAGAITSVLIARAEHATITWPAAWVLLRALGGAWLILAAWTAFGTLLAVLSRGTALAVGLGITYTLVIEGLLSALASRVSWLRHVAEYFLRGNAYSLVTALGVPTDSLSRNGPGVYFGPFDSGSHALTVLASYLAAFLVLSALLLHRRDVT